MYISCSKSLSNIRYFRVIYIKLRLNLFIKVRYLKYSR